MTVESCDNFIDDITGTVQAHFATGSFLYNAECVDKIDTFFSKINVCFYAIFFRLPPPYK